MPEQIQTKLIEEEMKQSYIDYAMSVITSRALPDVRDGLKPVHRRILYAMYKSKLFHDHPFRKSAFVNGRVISAYHPHGDIAVYDALVRLAQDFSMRYPLVEGHGNFGSIDGFPPAASRYTEVRLAKMSEELLTDIEKDTVKFIPNYDNSTKEPVVLPSKIPNLLINGSSGIAVGMATNIPPHNLSEVTDALIALINNPELTIKDLMQYIHGPDFPTGALICGSEEIKKAYETGRGKLIVKAKTKIEKNRITITEIPYMLNKTLLIEEIAKQVQDNIIEGISDIRDESDRKGLCIAIETKPNQNPEVILNQLLKHTQLKTTFGVIMLALVNGIPKILNLKELLQEFISHRKEVVTKRTIFDLETAEERAHILEGLKIALSNIEDVIKTIKGSNTPDIAKSLLIEIFKLSEKQSQAILEMRLQRLTSLETNKLIEEHKELLKKIEEYKAILSSEEKIFDIIKQEILEIKKTYANKRKTEITDELIMLEKQDLVPEEDMVITVTHSGYIKRLPITIYKIQKRGGKGIKGTETKEKDFVKDLFITSTHDTILFFTNLGNLYWLKAYEIPSAGRYSAGKAIINLLNLKGGENITTLIPVKDFSKDYLVMLTKHGLIKKTPLKYFSKPRSSGIICMKLKCSDELVNVVSTNGSQNLILATKKGMVIHFSEGDIKPVGRNALGIRGIKLKNNDEVISLDIAKENSSLLTLTENGFGKRSSIKNYRLIRRGGVGVINIKTSERNGNVVAVKTVSDLDDILLITQKGIVMRTKVQNISKIGRNTLGLRIIKLSHEDKLISIAKVIND